MNRNFNAPRFVRFLHILRQYASLNMYSIKPFQLGVEVQGVDLKAPVSDEIIEEIKGDVTKHRLLIFRNQGCVSGNRHVEISQWFGELESTFYKHPRSPHPDVFRVSNSEDEGCRNVGRTGWHIDGSFMVEPFRYSIYHMVSVPKSGDTAFLPLLELIQSLGDKKFARWNRLWMASDRQSKGCHPVIYTHPTSKLQTMCFHLGMTEAFVWDHGSDQERITDRNETADILKEIHAEIMKNKSLIYRHKWEVGDFIISDNLAVGHEATPETQFPAEDVGLRVLHRTTVRGITRPMK